MNHSGYPLGNRDPKRRGLGKEIRNKRNASKKGCPLTVLVFLAISGGAVTVGWHLAQQLFG